MGRKPKEKLSLREQEDNVIYKALYRTPMTLEETALALHMYDNAHGIKSKKPMSKMGMLKYEARIMEKLRKECEARGFTRREVLEILQAFNNCRRSAAAGNYENSIDEY